MKKEDHQGSGLWLEMSIKGILKITFLLRVFLSKSVFWGYVTFIIYISFDFDTQIRMLVPYPQDCYCCGVVCASKTSVHNCHSPQPLQVCIHLARLSYTCIGSYIYEHVPIATTTIFGTSYSGEKIFWRVKNVSSVQ